MKKMLFILLAVLGLVSCRQDRDELRDGGNQASTETKLVSLNLAGDLELPLEDLAQQGKALTLVPNTKRGKPVLTPTFDEGDEVAALCYVTTLDKTQSSALLPVTLRAGQGGTKLSFYGDVPVPSSMLTGQSLLLSVFVGFDAQGGLKDYPTVAPFYAKEGVRTPIKDYPVALEAKAQIDYQGRGSSPTAGSYRNLALKFKLVGSLIRCAIKNETEQELTVTGLELHGLGAQGVKLAKPTSGASQETFVTSDETDPATTVRLYTLPSPIKLQPNGDVAYYIVYAPLVSKADGRDRDYKGYVRPILSNATLQAEYAEGQTAKVLPQIFMGKLVQSTIVLREKSPIQPHEIPLQYWNCQIFYKPAGGPATSLPFGKWPRVRMGAFDNRRFELIWGAYPGQSNDFYFRSDEVTPTEVKALAGGLHVPTAAELDGILPPGIIEPDPAQYNLPIYYRTKSVYSLSKSEEIEVAGKRLAGKSSYWRAPLEDELQEKVMTALFWQGELSIVEPVYALRFGKLSEAEIAAYKAQGFQDKELVKDNKSRVAYMYIFSKGEILIRSCYIGENDEIATAEDLRTKEVFREESSEYQEFQTSYNGYDIFFRPFPYYGALYSTPAVDQGARRFPFTRQNIRLYGSFKGRYTDREIPPRYTDLVAQVYPPSGLLRLKSRGGRALESVWFYRNDEGQLSSPIHGWMYEDQPTSAGSKYFVRDLPEGGGRYFAFPLYLMSDKSQTALSLTR